MMSEFEDLPVEILKQIIEFCPFVRFEDYHNVASINRAMFKLLRVQQEGIEIDNRAFKSYKILRRVGIEINDYDDFKKVRRIEERHFQIFRVFGIISFVANVLMNYFVYTTFGALNVFFVTISCLNFKVHIILFTLMSICLHFITASFLLEILVREVNMFFLKKLKREFDEYKQKCNYFYPRRNISCVCSVACILLNRFVFPAINDENYSLLGSNIPVYLSLFSILPLLYYNFRQLKTENLSIMYYFGYKTLGPIILTTYESIYLYYVGLYYKHEHPNSRKQKWFGIVGFPIFMTYMIFSLSRVKYLVDIMLYKYQLNKTVFFIYFIRIFIPFMIGWFLWATVFVSNMLHPLTFCTVIIILHFLFNPLMFVSYNPSEIKKFKKFLSRKSTHKLYRELFLPNKEIDPNMKNNM